MATVIILNYFGSVIFTALVYNKSIKYQITSMSVHHLCW